MTDVIGTDNAETLTGTSANDDITGNGGGDLLSGGGGFDVYHYLKASDSNAAGYDIITDFSASTDKLDFTALNATSVSLVYDGSNVRLRRVCLGHAGDRTDRHVAARSADH